MGNTPNIRFKGFTDDWEQRKFVNVFDGLQNNTLSRADLNYESGTVKNVHYGDVLIKFGEYIDASKTDLPYISDDTKADKFKSSFLQNGDIIIADTAEDDTVGKCTEIQGSEGLKLLSGLHTIACRPKEKYGPLFLGYYINSPAYHNQLKPLMQGIKVTSISKSALQDTDMIIPKSIDEQMIIGEYFSNLDNLITLHQRKCDETKELKKFMLQKMFPKKGEKKPEIRFAGFTDDWEQRKVLDLLIQPVTDGPHETPELVEEGVPFISVDAIVDNKIDFSRKRGNISEKYDELCCKKYKPQLHDVYLVKSGSTVGKVAIVETTEKFNIWSPLAAMRCGDKTYPYFLYNLLQTKDLQAQVADKASNGTQPNLSMRELEKFPVCVPSNIEEQKKIGAYFEQLDNLITLHQRKCDEAKELKKFMLQNMFV